MLSYSGACTCSESRGLYSHTPSVNLHVFLNSGRHFYVILGLKNSLFTQISFLELFSECQPFLTPAQDFLDDL